MPERTTAPIGYARYANDFFRAAIMVDRDMGEEAGYEIVAPILVMYLIGHSVELSLKSFLLHTGTTEAELKNQLRHDLSKALVSAQKTGLEDIVVLESDELEVLGHLNVL